MVGSLDSCTRHVQNNSFLTFTLANKIRFTPALNRTHSLIRSVWFRILYKACLRLQNACEYQSMNGVHTDVINRPTTGDRRLA